MVRLDLDVERVSEGHRILLRERGKDSPLVVYTCAEGELWYMMRKLSDMFERLAYEAKSISYDYFDAENAL